MATELELKTASALLCNAFALSETPSFTSAEDYLSALQRALSQRIEEILATEPARLSNILYRIDVDEGKVADILEREPVAQVPEKLARLIIARQLEKAKWRIFYKGRSSR